MNRSRVSVKWSGVVAALAAVAAMSLLLVGSASAANFGVSVLKDCQTPINVGDAYSCQFEISNTVQDSQLAVTVKLLTDHVTASGPVPDLVLPINNTTPGLILEGGATCDPTQCTIPFGGAITTSFISHYSVVVGDFPAVADQGTFTWNEVCNGFPGCSPADNQNQASASATINPLDTQTATTIHDAAHNPVTAVAVGSTVHDFVSVTAVLPNEPAPQGDVVIDWFPSSGDCTGNKVTSTPFTLDASGQVDATTFAFPVNSVGQKSFLAHYLGGGGGAFLPSDGPCEPLSVVDANIQITPAQATNPLGTNHVLTITVNSLGGNLADGTATASIVSGPGSFVGSPTCSYTGGGATASCTVTITSTTAGTTVVHAASDIGVSGVTMHRETDGTGLNSTDAQKVWVSPDANIQITPATATNPVGTNHTLTGHVNVAADGVTFANAPAGTLIAFSIVSGPGSFVGGVNTCMTVGATGSCTVQITSATAGTTVVHALTDVTVSGVVLHRETDGTGLNSGNAQKVWINPDANIQITPATATNAVGTNHTLTGHVNVAPDGVTFANAPAGTLIAFSIVSGPGSFVGGVNTCTTVGATGSCTVQITSTTVGTTVVKAATDVTVSGVTLHRETGDANAGDSANASKAWVDANIQITPATADNPVATNHTLTITVNAVNGTLAAGTATASIVSGPGSFVGSPTCNYAGGGASASCTVVITSNVAGTTIVSATSSISVNGVSITRTTGTAANTAAGGSGNASKNWTSLASGRVTGGGSIFATVNGVPNVRVTHGFELRCDPADKRQSLEINWDGGNNFHLSKIINSVVCFDDPLSSPPPPPGTVIDTYAGDALFNGQTGYHGYGYAVGTGTCNKAPAMIWFILVDNGEPGTADIAEYHIVSQGCTLDAGPALIMNGNHQFHKS